MSIASEITRLQNAKSALKTAIEGKGVSVPASTKLDGYSALVDSIEQGGGTDDDNWYMIVGDNYSEDYEGHFKVYFHPDYDSSRWMIYGSAGDISSYDKYIWFEYKGENYYVDNLNNGDHTLSKQGSPVYYQGKFMAVSIKKSGDNYVFNCIED